MTNHSIQFNRRAYLKTTGLATAGMIALAGCTGTGEDGNADGSDNGTEDDDSAFGTLSTSITDQPNDIGDFEELIVTIDGIWIKPNGAEDDQEQADDTAEELDQNSDDEEVDEPEEDGDNTGEQDGDDTGEQDDIDEDGDDVDQGEGRRYIEFDEPQQADLVDLQGDNTQLIDETDVEVGEYLFLQLDVSSTDGILVEDGSEAAVETPGNAPLQFQQDFEIRADEQTRFIGDFAPMRRGQGSYIIRPVATGTRVFYGDEAYTAANGEADDADDVGQEPSNETDESAGDDQQNGQTEDN